MVTSNGVNGNSGNLNNLIYGQSVQIVEDKVKNSCINPQKENMGWKKDKPNIFGYRLDRRNESEECTTNKNWYNNLQIMLDETK